MTLSLEELLELGVVPNDLKVLDNKLIESRCVPVSEALNPESESYVGSNKIVIADDTEWVGLHKTGTFSGCKNGFVWKTSRGNKAITRYELRDGRLKPAEFITIDKKTKNKFKEDFKMENTKKEAADELLKDMEDLGNEGSLGESKAFADGEGKDKSAEELAKEAEKAAREAEAKRIQEQLKGTLTKDTKDIKVSNLTALNIFTTELGQLYGYIMGNAPKVSFGTKTTTLKSAQGVPVLLPDAPTDVRQAFAAKTNGTEGQKIDNKYFQKQKEVTARQSGPSQLLGIVFSMPAGAIIPENKLRASDELVFDDTKTDEVTLIQSKDAAQTMIATYFGGTIKESPITHEIPGTVTCKYTLKPDKDGVPVYKIAMKTSRSKLYTEKNWIARKTPKTLSLAEIVSDPEKSKAVNEILFSKFWETPEGADKQPTYDLLSIADKAKFSKDAATGVITSEYFKKGGKVPPIFAYFDSSKELPVIEIPEKKKQLKKDSTTEFTYKPIVFDILKPEKGLESLDPSNDKRFDTFKSILPAGVSIKDAIKKVVSTSTTTSNGGRNSKTVVLSPEDTMKLVQGTIANPDNIVAGLSGVWNSDKTKSLNETIQRLSIQTRK